VPKIFNLTGVTEGTFLVKTASGTWHLIYLDRMTMCRIPPAGHDPSALRRDTDEIDLVQLVRCVVGTRMNLIVNLHLLGVTATMRWSSPVVSIEAVLSEGVTDVADPRSS
jgi:hypothetical protein